MSSTAQSLQVGAQLPAATADGGSRASPTDEAIRQARAELLRMGWRLTSCVGAGKLTALYMRRKSGPILCLTHEQAGRVLSMSRRLADKRGRHKLREYLQAVRSGALQSGSEVAQ
jgi:hypothetical protein